MKVDKNYIIWSLFSIPILVGSFLIFRNWIIENNIPAVHGAVIVKHVERPLRNPPKVIQAIYYTGPTAGNDKKIDELIELKNNSSLNAVVIDIKDYSGYIGYDTNIELAEKYGTEKKYIKDIDSLIRELHENNIYVIARITVFQDPVMANANPELAVKNKLTGGVWTDKKGLAWLDPSNHGAWEYIADIAKDAQSRGFDEINFDYVRFPTDGDLNIMVFPAWDKAKTRPQVLNQFFKYLTGEMGEGRLSVDMFGFVTTRKDDFGVGQVIEDAFEYFDYVSPMVYPSHYPNNFIGFANPAEHPYEVVNYALSQGEERLRAFYETTNNRRAKIRPWLQDFNLGANYNADMVMAEIKATQDALGDNYKGFMLWNARNVYTTEVLKK